MIGLGTLINVGAIIIGGLLGLFLGRNVKAKGGQYFADSVSGHEKGAADAAPCV